MAGINQDDTIANSASEKHNLISSEPTASERKQSRLLTLPAELREMIWDYALTGRDRIHYTQRLTTPALTRTCTQIRLEALPPWIKNNRFEVFVRDCDPTILQHFDTFFTRIYAPFEQHYASSFGGILSIRVGGREHCGNLKRWCKLIWAHYLQPIPKKAIAHDKVKVVMSAHSIACKYRDRGWEECEEALDDLIFAVCGYDAAWTESKEETS